MRFPTGSLESQPFREILQEGLTNVLKHAHAQIAYVRVRYDVTQFELEVRDDGRGPTPSSGFGHGLVGIGERVKIYGVS